MIFIAGGITALGQEPFSLPIFTIIGIGIGIYFFGKEQSFKRTFLAGLGFGSGYALVLMHWIVFPFFVEPEKTGWLAPFALIVMVLGFALFWGFAFGLPILIAGLHWVRFIVLAVSWTSIEIIREYIFTGFPWGLLGYIWGDTPIAQLASIVGVHGLSFFTLLAVILPFVIRRKWLGSGISIVFAVLLWLYGDHRLTNGNELSPTSSQIRIIQPNVPQNEKWNPLKLDLYLNHLIELSNSYPSENIDLVIWPETALTIFADEQDFYALSQWVEKKPLLLGYRRIVDGKMFNSMGYIATDGLVNEIYDKQYLVPFGEFIPLERLLKFLTFSPLVNQEIWDFSSGTTSQFMKIPEVGNLRALICYEAIFPHLVRTKERPEALIQITNDAWIGKNAGPKQHYVMAKFRSIELGLPLLRSSNPGISAVVDSYGNEVAIVPLNQSGFIDAKIPSSIAPTIYSNYGDWPLKIFLVLITAFLLVWRRSNSTLKF